MSILKKISKIVFFTSQRGLFYLSKKDLFALFLSIIPLCYLDLITKFFAFNIGENYIVVTSFFNIVKVRNYGISFGIFNDRTASMKLFILIFDIAVILYLITNIKHCVNYKKPIFIKGSIFLIIGGAIGNMVDRIKFGYVRDFLDFHLGTYHWASFNLADAFICCGVFFWVICEIFHKKVSK